MQLYTIGHSNRNMETFLSLLVAFGIRAVADVRRFPSSRKFPHFNKGLLEAHLKRADIVYAWFEDLGGRRPKGQYDNPLNDGLDSPAFRHYADYMQTKTFAEAACKLSKMGEMRPTAVMCAEKLHVDCHRNLLCDFLKARGIDVVHILDEGKSESHEFSSLARITKEKKVIYPSPLFHPFPQEPLQE